MSSKFKPKVIWPKLRTHSKMAEIGEKQRRAAKISTLCRKSMSLNPFSVRNFRPEVELMYLLRMRSHCRHKNHRKCRALEMTAIL